MNTNRTYWIYLLHAAAAAVALFPGASAVNAQTVSLAGQSGNWNIYADTADPKKLCFIAARPTESLPAGANRSPVYFYVTSWPKDGVRSEISVKLGYPIKAGSEPVISVGADTFKLYIKDDRAFISEPVRELKVIEAMKKGSTLVVKATSERGTETTDTFSLAGVSQALQSLTTSCP